MTKHIICWQLKDELSAEEKLAVKSSIKEGLEGLLGVVPGLVDVHVYTDSLPTSTADLMLDSTFENEDALAAYKIHPAHVAVATGRVRPNVQVRLCVDYNL